MVVLVLEDLVRVEEDVVLRAVLREAGVDLALVAAVEEPEAEEGVVGEVDFSRIEEVTNRRHEYRLLLPSFVIQNEETIPSGYGD